MKISDILIAQRVRNRIIENLEFSSRLSNVAKWGAFETINGWFDWIETPLDTDFFKPPIFSDDEVTTVKKLTEFYNIVADATRDDINDEKTLKAMKSWTNLEFASKNGHSVFMERGKFSEEKEQF